MGNTEMADNTDIMEKLADAEMILVGLGEEFDGQQPSDSEAYERGKNWLREKGFLTCLPLWNEFCEKKQGRGDKEEALNKLCSMLKDKNYFIVSTAMEPYISQIPWREDRLVMPCGSGRKLQCGDGCMDTLTDLTAEGREKLQDGFERLFAGETAAAEAQFTAVAGSCPVCGGQMVFNNIYAENYNEEGYLPQWQLYKKWLQGTVNHKLLILELGVGMQFPTVIRWPFEKVAFFNEKAVFYRINEKLYQLTQELSEKGISVPKNAIDWLRQL